MLVLKFGWYVDGYTADLLSGVSRRLLVCPFGMLLCTVPRPYPDRVSNFPRNFFHLDVVVSWSISRSGGRSISSVVDRLVSDCTFGPLVIVGVVVVVVVAAAYVLC